MRVLSAVSTFLLSAVTAIGAIGPASAQAPGTWTGLYIGANAGYGWSSAGHSATPGGAWIGDPDWPPISGQLNRSLDLGGFIGGGQAGFNLQSGMIVLGAEIDANWLDASGSFGTPRFLGVAGGTWDASGSAAVGWLATLRARLGLSAGNALYYVTGGLAVAETRFSQHIGYRNVPPPPTRGGGAGTPPDRTSRRRQRWRGFRDAGRICSRRWHRAEARPELELER